MIFSKHGRTSKQKQSTFRTQGHTIDITKFYTYLGIDITPSGSFSRATKQLRLKALRASFKLKSLLASNHNPSISLALDLFHSLVKPILLYCAEVLGTNIQCRDLIFNGVQEYPAENIREGIYNILSPILGSNIQLLKVTRLGKKNDVTSPRPVLVRFKRYSDKLNILYQSELLSNQNILLTHPKFSYEVSDLEHVLLNYCKILLQVPRSSVNAAVRGELGTFPLYIEAQSQLIKYWLRLQNLPNDRIVKKAYDFAVEQEQDWAVHVQDILCRHGFQNVWLNPAVDAKHFGNVFKERLKDTFVSGWRQEIRNYSKLQTYSKFKTNFTLEKYLSSIQNKSFVANITKLRISAHCLEIEKGRYNNIPATQRRCPTCNHGIEDELHFLLLCPTYTEERQKLMDVINKTTNITLPKTSSETFNLLMSCPDAISLYIGQYISTAFQKRNRIDTNT
ncbi:uncharacterized protein LOC118427738 [Branchiostoma floridae]|uniref:Uncharacterized protein LOC118427738 n=1 Tax=Branchiostoma floridae TaxID=7739 RepID=A0A9J7M334_BRAFL|nr:uncharacterized protein LOC118427738 [Branchiostoma floridae]